MQHLTCILRPLVTAQGLPHPLHKHGGTTLKGKEQVREWRLCTKSRVVVLSCRVSTVAIRLLAWKKTPETNLSIVLFFASGLTEKQDVF